ncbi:glycoside hydrolase, partial [Mycolicibacterium farcinogenes]|nr:glycoside hydrolase [Mycolicibacterium farcinogenes]
MPSASAQLLAAPLYELRDLVGRGRPAVTALETAHTALADVAAALGRSWDRVAADWSGTAAIAAADFTAGAAAEAAALA